MQELHSQRDFLSYSKCVDGDHKTIDNNFYNR